MLIRACLILPLWSRLLPKRFPPHKTPVRGPVGHSTLILLGSGGHTGEMSRLIPGLLQPTDSMVSSVGWYDETPPGLPLHPRHYLVSTGDVNSTKAISSLESSILENYPELCPNKSTPRPERFGGLDPVDYSVHYIPRARDFGQSYFTSIFSTLKSGLTAFRLVWSLKPQLILTNGPGTAVPIVLAAYFARLLGRFSTHYSPALAPRVTFVESIARVSSVSLTGLLLWPFVDDYIVQWPPSKSSLPWPFKRIWQASVTYFGARMN